MSAKECVRMTEIDSRPYGGDALLDFQPVQAKAYRAHGVGILHQRYPSSAEIFVHEEGRH